MFNYYHAEPTAQFAAFQNTPLMVCKQIQTIRYDCAKCDSIFTSRLYLHHHEASAHNRIFHCPFCESLFSNKADYATHVIAHKEKRILNCAFCRKVFHDVDEYAIHTKLHTEPFMYKCDKCSAMFSQLSKLRTHSAIHVNRKFFHTVTKFKKRRMICPCTNPSEDNSSNPPESNGEGANPLPCGQDDAEVGTAQEPEASCSRSHESKENSPEKSSHSSRKRKKKDKKQKRHQKKTKAARNSRETGSQTLPEDNIEMMQPIPSTSGFKRVTRQQDRLTKNANATERATETDHRELSDNNTEATSATEKQIPSNSVPEIAARRVAGRSRRNLRSNAETETEAGRSLENDIESTSAPEQQPSSLTENQETGAERRPTIKTRVLRRPKSNKTGKKCSRPRTNIKEPNRFERILRSRLQKYQTAGSVTATAAGKSSEDNIEVTSAPEEQVFSLNQEVLSSEDQANDTAVTSAARKRVSSPSKNETMGKKPRRPLRSTAETVTQTEASTLYEDIFESYSAPAESISSAINEILTTLEETDAPVNSATKRQPLTCLKNQNVGRGSSTKRNEAPKKTSETNSTQPRNENRDDLVEDESIPLSQVQGQENHLPIIDEPIPLSQVQIQGQENHLSVIDLTSSPDRDSEATVQGPSLRLGEVTSSQKKTLAPAKKPEVQKPKPASSSQTLVQKAPAVSVSVVRNVTVPFNKFQFIQNAAPISRVTVLKPVSSSKTTVEPARATAVTSGSQTSTAKQAEGMPLKRRPIYKTNFSNGGETTESTDTTAQSSTEKEPAVNSENADSVYIFEEENLNKKTNSSNTECSSPNKRRRSELWRFFVPVPKMSKKNTKTATHSKRRKSVHFYKCTRCIRVFQNNDLLSKHELIHSENRGFPCNLCGGVFGGHGNLVSHQKLTHNL